MLRGAGESEGARRARRLPEIRATRGVDVSPRSRIRPGCVPGDESSRLARLCGRSSSAEARRSRSSRSRLAPAPGEGRERSRSVAWQAMSSSMSSDGVVGMSWRSRLRVQCGTRMAGSLAIHGSGARSRGRSLTAASCLPVGVAANRSRRRSHEPARRPSSARLRRSRRWQRPCPPSPARGIARVWSAVQPFCARGRVGGGFPLQGAAAQPAVETRKTWFTARSLNSTSAASGAAQEQYGQCSRRADGTATGQLVLLPCVSLRSSRAPRLRCWRSLSATSTSTRRSPHRGGTTRAPASRSKRPSVAVVSSARDSYRGAAATAAARGQLQGGRRDERHCDRGRA